MTIGSQNNDANVSNDPGRDVAIRSGHISPPDIRSVALAAAWMGRKCRSMQVHAFVRHVYTALGARYHHCATLLCSNRPAEHAVHAASPGFLRRRGAVFCGDAAEQPRASRRLESFSSAAIHMGLV